MNADALAKYSTADQAILNSDFNLFINSMCVLNLLANSFYIMKTISDTYTK